MKTILQTLRLALGLSLAATLSAQAATSGSDKDKGTTPPAKPETPGKAAPHTVNDHASDNAKAVQAGLQKFDAQRDALIAERKALLDKLAAAKTDAERKAILDQLKAENEARHEEQKALGKEIRDEIKKQREARKSGG